MSDGFGFGSWGWGWEGDWVVSGGWGGGGGGRVVDGRLHGSSGVSIGGMGRGVWMPFWKGSIGVEWMVVVVWRRLECGGLRLRHSERLTLSENRTE